MHKNKKTKINLIDKKVNKCFQYAIKVALNLEKIGKNPERLTKIKPFINKYNWKGIKYPSENDDWIKFEKIDLTIALNVLYPKIEKIYTADVSKYNSNREK